MSRRMFLHAPANATAEVVAHARVYVIADAEYMVLARYEAVMRFESAFTLTVQQHGRTLLHRVYGRRSNFKVWGGRNQGTDTYSWNASSCAGILNRECGSGMVWEGINTTVMLTKGMATISLAAHVDANCVPWPGSPDCQHADRNVDAILLHPNRSDVETRWNSTGDPGVLLFDGLFSQAGEVGRPARICLASIGPIACL